MSNSLPLSRRAFLAGGAVIATSLIAAPHLALATQASIQGAETTVLVDPSLSATELDRALDSKTHAEGDELIRSLMSMDAENASTLSSRPTYDNVYESPPIQGQRLSNGERTAKRRSHDRRWRFHLHHPKQRRNEERVVHLLGTVGHRLGCLSIGPKGLDRHRL